MRLSCSPSSDGVSVSAILHSDFTLSLKHSVYVFIGSVIVGEGWYRIIPGTLVGIVGIGYVVLEYIPSIEPPANMR
jgi:hypothetical protein